MSILHLDCYHQLCMFCGIILISDLFFSCQKKGWRQTAGTQFFRRRDNKMQKVHVRNIFRLYVPLSLPEGFDVLPQEDPNFGFNLRGSKSSANYFYKLELLCLDNEEMKARTFTNDWATWAKRNPVYFKNNAYTNILEGITIRIKINNSMFDFRKVPEQLVRISLNYYSDGVLVQQATSNVFELLPKKSQGSVDDEGNASSFFLYKYPAPNESIAKDLVTFHLINVLLY